MKYKIVKQPDEMNCGVACLSMICAYYGMTNMSLAVIRNFAQTDRDGNSIYSLRIAAEKLHLDSEAYEAEKEDLINHELQLPAIVHTFVDGLYLHYMVLFEANKKNVVLGDPGVGQITMKWDEFLNIWTGKVIELKPNENFSENKKYKKNYKFVTDMILKYKSILIKLLIITAILSAISMYTAKFYSKLIDNIIPASNLRMLVQLIMITIGIYLFTISINWVKLLLTIKLNKELDRELIINIYNRITNSPMSFFATRTSGDLSTRFEDGNTIREIITDFTLDFVIDFVYALVAIVIIWIHRSWQIIVLMLVMLELIVIIQQIFKYKMTEQTKKAIKADTEVHSYANSTFLGSETIKSYNSEKLVERNMSNKYSDYQNVIYKSQKYAQIQDDMSSIIMQVFNIFMLAVLGILVMQGDITAGDLMYLYILIDYISKPVDYLIDIQDNLYEVDAALERLEDVFRTSTEEEMNKNKNNLNEKIEKIEFKNVVFQYGLRDPVIKDISFSIEAGQSIGIIGTSGSGKTTLIKLILKFYEITDGAILINGKDINTLTSSSLRKKIAYVMQNDFWFQDTIFNNLTIGNEHASEEDVYKVLELVNMKEFIDEKESGLNSMIEEGGTNLSTGQKQRLSIAKSLITNPDVLVLDESTSNLDAKTEELIVNNLSHEKDKIKIVIAHRLNTLARCDKIISIEDGVITEFGTPYELLNSDGMFYKLWKAQSNISLTDEKVEEEPSITCNVSNKNGIVVKEWQSDNNVSFKDGMITEFGTSKEPIKNNGKFSEFWNSKK